MQSEGGYRYPRIVLCATLTLLVLLIASVVGLWRGLGLLRTMGLLMNLEGTVLLASACWWRTGSGPLSRPEVGQ